MGVTRTLALANPRAVRKILAIDEILTSPGGETPPYILETATFSVAENRI